MSSKIPQLMGRQAPGSKIPKVSLDHTKAQVPPPADTTGLAETRIQVNTVTVNSTPGSATTVLYGADRVWARVTVTLTTAGPVSIGQFANLLPVLGGNGMVLQTGVPVTMNIAKGNILYVAANSLNRVNVVVEPYPWLETITGLLTAIAVAAAKAIASKIG